MKLQKVYNFNDVPTIRKFYLSNKKIRAIVGPYGSGKSSGCVVTLLKVAAEQQPDPEGVRYTRFVIIRNCYSDDTEVMTKDRGWVLFKDLQPDDKVAQFNPKKCRLEFVTPTYYYCAPYKGKMIGLQSQNLDLLVTPDHRLYVATKHTRKKVWGDYHFEFAKDCYGKGETLRFRITAPQANQVYPNYSTDFFEFLGFWLADGYCGKYERKDTIGFHYRLVLIQKKYVEYVRDLLRRNELEFSEAVSQDSGSIHFTISINAQTKQLVDDILLSFGKGSSNKKIPSWVKQAPPPHLKAFLYGFQMGDGSFKTGPNSVNRLATSSKQLADDLQEIALRAGLPAIVSQSGNDYRVTLLTEHRAFPVVQKRHWYQTDYDGKVYCVEVPSHIILVRRNGKPVLCSQTYRQLKDTTKRTIDEWLTFAEWKESDHSYTIHVQAEDGTIIHSEWLLRALDRPEHVANLLSLEVTAGWINEAREIPKEIFDALEARLRYPPTIRDEEGNIIYGPTWRGILLDTNPPDTDHWFYKYFEEDRPEKAEIYHQPSGLSPEAENIRNLPDENYYLELMEGKDPEWIDIYIHGKYGSLREGMPVFTLYNDKVHCAKEPLAPIPGLNTLIIGMDFGLTPAAVITQQPPGRLLVLDEVVTFEPIDVMEFTRMFLLPFLSSEKYKFKHYIVVGDPAGTSRSQSDGRSCFQVLNQLGIRAYPAYSNSLQLRINAVNQYLSRLDPTSDEARPAFQLSPTCVTLRKALKSQYKLKRINIGGERYTDAPVKNKYSHVAEALQYGALGHTPNSINIRTDIPVQDTSVTKVAGIGYY